MNIFIFLFTICSYGVMLLGVYGKRKHTGNSFYDHKRSYAEKPKYKLKQILDIYSENENIASPTEHKHLFKLNVDAPEKIPNFYDKETAFRRKPYFHSNRRKSLSSEIGKHLIKVTSALQSKHVEFKQPEDGGYEISVNPKFSHTIEILPIEKKDLAEEPDPETSEVSEKLGQKLDTEEAVETEGEPDTEEAVETESEPVPEEAVETESEPVPEEAVETESEPVPEEAVETESEPVPEEAVETESEPVSEEVETESDTYEDDTEVTTVGTKEIIETEVPAEKEETDIQQLSGNDNHASAFNSDFEGSGEDVFTSGDSEDDPPKSGRLFSVFSPQNTTGPNCTTPKGEAGQCKLIRQCILSDTLNNFNNFVQHLCLIRGALVGICCPDNPVIEISDPDDNTVSLNETDIKQPPEGCGLNVKTRIVGGTISAPHEWTWMVALLRRNRFYCGGVIINNWFVLTAAHCVMGMNVKDLSVRLGEYDFNTHNKHKEDILVSEIKRHAQFVQLTFQHDIALLKLKRSIQYSKFVGSVCLPEMKSRDYSDAKGTVVGWGTVSFGGAASPVLRQVTVPVWKNEDCDRIYSLENISDAFMCAGSPEKGEDACQGDSGGPLMALNDRGRWEVIGLVSWGRRCGDPTYPGVYTRVTTYLDWIKENIN